MEDPGNITYIGSSPKGFGDDKHVLDSPETGTHSPPAAAATATATVHWSHLVSEKLSTWGVESRGAAHACPENLIDPLRPIWAFG
jgi:hypothetical protein